MTPFFLLGNTPFSNVNPMQLKGSVILITGAAKRVGKTIAWHLAHGGAEVIIHCNRSVREAQALREKIREDLKGKAHVLQGDLSKFSELKRIGQEAWSLRGRVDVLVNNASTFYPTPLGKVSDGAWEDLFAVNAKAPFFLSEYLGLKMKARGRGKIVNVADWAALRPYTQYIPYCASKAALVAISQGMAKSLAPEVQVNTVLPGPVMWPKDLGKKVKAKVIQRTPLKRIGTPEDVANAVQFFIEGGDFMTGSLLHVDGGRNIE